MFPGQDSQSQIELIVKFTGTPSQSVLRNIPSPEARNFLKAIKVPKNRIPARLEAGGKDMMDLAQGMLAFDPKRRLDVNESLAHPYMSTLHCPEDEPEGKPLTGKEFSWEKEQDTDEQTLRSMILEEIMYHNKELYLEDDPADGGGKGREGGGGAAAQAYDDDAIDEIRDGMKKVSIDHK